MSDFVLVCVSYLLAAPLLGLSLLLFMQMGRRAGLGKGGAGRP